METVKKFNDWRDGINTEERIYRSIKEIKSTEEVDFAEPSNPIYKEIIEKSETNSERAARIYTSIIRRLDKIHNNIEIEDSHTQDEILDAILVKTALMNLYTELSETLKLEISQLNAKDDEINNERFEPSYDEDQAYKDYEDSYPSRWQ